MSGWVRGRAVVQVCPGCHGPMSGGDTQHCLKCYYKRIGAKRWVMEDIVEQVLARVSYRDVARSQGITLERVRQIAQKYNRLHNYCLGMMLGVVVDRRFQL